MIKELLLSLLCTAALVQATEPAEVKFAFIDTNGKSHEIQRCFVDPQIRNIPADKLGAALQHFVIRLVQLDNGEIAVRAHVKGLGGGPISAMAARASVWAGFALLCSQEGPLCATHYAEFNMAAEAAYWAVFFVPWLP